MPWFFWLFPLAFAVHNIEEALFLPGWSKSAGRFHKPVGEFEFVFALVVLTTASVVITVLAGSAGKQTLPSYLFFAFNFGMLVNVFYPHLTATIVLKRYCPGLFTGVLFLVPTTGYLLLYGLTITMFCFRCFGSLLFHLLHWLSDLSRCFSQSAEVFKMRLRRPELEITCPSFATGQRRLERDSLRTHLPLAPVSIDPGETGRIGYLGLT